MGYELRGASSGLLDAGLALRDAGGWQSAESIGHRVRKKLKRLKVRK